MADNFEFISAGDKAALIAFTTPTWLDAIKGALEDLHYKVNTAATHNDFLLRYSRIRYDIVVLEELFCASGIAENITLNNLQNMPMAQRRHSPVILIGDSFQTYSSQQAFQQSVHTVINPAELFLIRELIEKAVSDNYQFLTGYRETQARIFAGKSRD